MLRATAPPHLSARPVAPKIDDTDDPKPIATPTLHTTTRPPPRVTPRNSPFFVLLLHCLCWILFHSRVSLATANMPGAATYFKMFVTWVCRQPGAAAEC